MSWERFKHYYLYIDTLHFGIDVSRIDFDDVFLNKMEPKIQAAFVAMQKLESGSIANVDEDRMVGHYWLRNSKQAPSNELTEAIESCIQKVKKVAANVHNGTLKGANGNFKNLLVIGIGGSSLGPQFVADALGDAKTDELKLYFFDNTDPDGFDRVLSQLDGQLGETLSLVISKSGGTPETRNGMIEAEAAYKASDLNFAEHAIAITGNNSKLYNYANENNWLDIFPMWDWVGGRTSVFSAVGLLPAAIQGIDIDRMLAGAAAMDNITRENETLKNPAALLALMWYHATDGKGSKDMVVLPYKDRLMLFSKYLQQLVMESLGKATDLNNNLVNQGITVYGNKGSTDQHAYVQQLREGVHNFFVTFIEVLKDRENSSITVEKAFTSGDFLQGFLLGTRDALYEKGRQSITLTIEEVTPEAVGQLIALFERAVGFYASLVNINAYHQPGVEAGKKAAATVLRIQEQVIDHIKANEGKPETVESIALQLGLEQHKEIIFKLLFRLAYNHRQLGMNIKTPASNTEFFST